MTSYFEINGEIISCEDAEDLVSAAPPNLPNSVIDAAMELHEQEMKEMAFDEQYWPLLEEPAASESDLKEFSKFQMIGRGMAGAGAAILMTPDPLPLVDEVVGAGMVVVGTAMFYWG